MNECVNDLRNGGALDLKDHQIEKQEIIKHMTCPSEIKVRESGPPLEGS